MRQHKYRFWNGKTMEEVGHLTFFSDGTYHINEEWPFPNKNNGEQALLEWTGLLDKNNKEIYESDIVKTPGYYAGFDNLEVIYGGGYWSPLVKVEEGKNCIDTFCPADFEVIGNVWENPELLK